MCILGLEIRYEMTDDVNRTKMAYMLMWNIDLKIVTQS